jgi:hypothetical protein
MEQIGAVRSPEANADCGSRRQIEFRKGAKSMVTRSYKQIGIRHLGLIVTLLLGMSESSAMPQKTMANKPVQVAVGLETRSATQDQLAREIRRQLDGRGISATEQEVQAAARRALDLISKGKDPQKGVIYVNTKKFTICASWGKDKDFCKSH